MGRPPHNLVAMSSNKLRVRRSFLNSEKRKLKGRSKISQARHSVICRAANKLRTEKGSDQEDNGDTLMDSAEVLDDGDQMMMMRMTMRLIMK